MFVDAIVNNLIHRARIPGLVLLAVGGFAAYDKYDKHANYLPAQARVTDVQESCHLEKSRRRRREWTDDMPCPRADAAVRTAQYSGFHVERRIIVAYDYVSPVDRKTHCGRQEYTAYPDGRPIARGQLLNIRVSKTDPTKTREA